MQKRALLFLLFLGMSFWVVLAVQPVLAQESEPAIPPAPTGGNVVLDTLGWLSTAQIEEINEINRKLDTAGVAQIAIVTLDNCGDDKQKFRNDLFRAWGIGHPNDNDGLLILACWYGGDVNRRSIEQETGYGLEGILPDVLTARVSTEKFIPEFEAGRPGSGIMAMVREYNRLLFVPSEPVPVKVETPDSLVFLFGLCVFIVIVASLISLFLRFIRRTQEAEDEQSFPLQPQKTRALKQKTPKKKWWQVLLEILQTFLVPSDGNSQDSPFSNQGSGHEKDATHRGGDSGGGGSSTRF